MFYLTRTHGVPPLYRNHVDYNVYKCKSLTLFYIKIITWHERRPAYWVLCSVMSEKFRKIKFSSIIFLSVCLSECRYQRLIKTEERRKLDL